MKILRKKSTNGWENFKRIYTWMQVEHKYTEISKLSNEPSTISLHQTERPNERKIPVYFPYKVYMAKKWLATFGKGVEMVHGAWLEKRE